MKTDCRLLPYAVIFITLYAGGGIRAEAQAAPVAAAVRPVPLAAALAAMPEASVADGNIVLTVQAGWIPPVPLATEAGQAVSDTPTVEMIVQTPETIAARYGRSLQVFGTVIALAPPTMMVLNTDPALADLPLSELAAQHPMPFLLGTLTAAQLQQMSSSGLGFSDLSPDQQALLKAALPSPFQIVPKALKPPMYSEGDFKKTGAERAEIDEQVAEEGRLYKLNTQTIPAERLLASLRLYGFLAPDFAFDDAGIGVGYSENGFKTTGSEILVNDGRTENAGPPGSTKLDKELRAEQPNTLKVSDLDWDRSALTKIVSLQWVKTVDDLTANLAKATGLELYADSRYGKQAVQVRGNLKSPQTAENVMQALAVCVCGTWRQVGPAYVLTDDAAGLGARQQFLHEMVQVWSNRLTEAGKAVGGHLGDLDWLHTLHFAPGDIGALSDSQVDALHKERGANDGNLLWKNLPGPLRAGLLGQLNRHFDGDNMGSYEATAHGVAKSLKPDSSVDVSFSFRIGVGLPDTGVMTLGDAYRVQSPPAPAPPGTAAPTKAQMNSIVLDKPLRGLLCAPKTPEEARAVVAMLPKMGLNALFLDVFTSGRAYFPNHALPPADAKASGVLQAAIEAARTAHVPIYAVLDLLCWRKDGAAVHPKPWPNHLSEDLTISGEAPDRSVRRQLDAGTIRADLDREYEMVEKGNQGWASPLDPRVAALLPNLVHDLAGTSGLSGLIFQDTAPPGYLALQYDYDDEGVSLGYTLENRLAFLRTHHSDPIDLSPNYDTLQLSLPFEGMGISLEASIPNFRSDTQVKEDWNKYRGDADKSLLANCYAAARGAAPALPLFMRERQLGATFDPWTDPKKLNQIASLDSLEHPFHEINSASLLRLAYGPIEKAHPDRLSWQMPGSGMVGEDGKRVGGEVFDLVTGGVPEDLLDTLDKLNVYLKKP